MKILPMLVTVKVSLWSGAVLQEQKFLKAKGIFQKLLSGFFPLRGGYPPFPLSFFEHNDCPLRGVGVYPPNPLRKILLESRFFRSKNSILLPFFMHF